MTENIDDHTDYAAMRADGYEIARDTCREQLGREPTTEKLDEEYQALCDKYKYGD